MAALAATVTMGALPAAAHAAPRAEITSGPSGTVTATDATFTFRATSQAAFQGYDCRLDGAPWERCDPPQHVDAMKPGRHAFEVRLLGLFVDGTPAHREWAVAEPPAKPAAAAPAPEAPAVAPAPLPATPAPAAEEPAADPLVVDGCRNGAAQAAQTTTRDLAAATLCLVNLERTRRGLAALRGARRLQRAAAAHVADMAARHYFDHASPDGTTPSDRMAAAGYMRHARAWSVGEVLHWAAGERSTPSAAVAGLLQSPVHRRLLLSPIYREVGIAVLARTPDGSADGAMYVLDLGRRR